jgi:hypothetical protein
MEEKTGEVTAVMRSAGKKTSDKLTQKPPD